MNEHSRRAETSLEVIAPDSSRENVTITQSPFNIGRGGEGDNIFSSPTAASRAKCAAIVAEGAGYRLEDRGNRYGLFVNGAKVQQQALRDGDVITFGLDGVLPDCLSCGIASPAPCPRLQVANLLTRIGTLSDLAGYGDIGRIEQAESAA